MIEDSRGEAARFARYLAVGAVNTAFGYGLFALFNFLFSKHFDYGYVAASVCSNIGAITLAYVNYKFLVFRTKGNYLREYLRFYVVYGFSFLLSLVLLPFMVEILQINSYLAGAILIPIGVIVSFLGHRNYSFRRGPM